MSQLEANAGRPGAVLIAILALGIGLAASWTPAGLPPVLDRPGTVALLAALGLAAALGTLGGNLPIQNRVAVAVVIGGISFGFHALPEVLTSGTVPGRAPLLVRMLLDTSGILAARGVARRLLEPVRTSPSFGFWLVGSAAILATLWSIPVGSAAFPGSHFHPAGQALCSLTALVAATPWVLSKRPVPESTHRQPAGFWTLVLIGVLIPGFSRSIPGRELALPVALGILPWAWEGLCRIRGRLP
jgi:hypothetical protein